VFVGLSLVYLSEIPSRLSGCAAGVRLFGPWQVLTGRWLMYLTHGVVFDLALGTRWWV
jgi:hypothetical protein